jgi:hypothetical protein
MEPTGERLGDEVAWVWTGRGHRYAQSTIDGAQMTPGESRRDVVTMLLVTAGVGVAVPNIRPLGAPAGTIGSAVTLLLRSSGGATVRQPGVEWCAATSPTTRRADDVQRRCCTAIDMTAIVESSQR